MIVMKFGGTSVQDVKAMNAVLDIVIARKDKIPLVVASACAGVTNQLLELAELSLSQRRKDIITLTCALRQRHLDIATMLMDSCALREQVMKTINDLCDEIERLCEGILLLRECTPRTKALLLSFGERLSNEILSNAFTARGHYAVLLDARTIVRTDSIFEQATPQMQEIERLVEHYCLPHLRDGAIVCTQGFIGSDEYGQTTVLGRGGSDLTAAILGAALHASEIQIWTDVSGVLTADPRMTASTRTVPEMSFEEASTLAFFGAKVLHPDTVRPAVEKRIPVRVLNTFQPLDAGTLLTPERSATQQGLRSVTAKKHCTLLQFRLKPDAPLLQTFGQIYSALAKYTISVFTSEGSERYLSIVVANSPHISTIVQELHPYVSCTTLSVSVVCACGVFHSALESTAQTPIITLVTERLTQSGITSCIQSSNGISLLVIVPEHAADETVRQIHEMIIPSLQLKSSTL